MGGLRSLLEKIAGKGCNRGRDCSMHLCHFLAKAPRMNTWPNKRVRVDLDHQACAAPCALAGDRLYRCDHRQVRLLRVGIPTNFFLDSASVASESGRILDSEAAVVKANLRNLSLQLS